jgi:hypothetical protein
MESVGQSVLAEQSESMDEGSHHQSLARLARELAQ